MDTVLNVFNKYKEVILYLFFGVLTTIVSLTSYYLCSEVLHIHYLISNVISWVFAVAFAYVTNRIFVFESKSNDLNSVLREIITFVNCRLLSGVIDTGVMFLLVSVLFINDLYAKLFTQVIVVVLNYVFSKLIILKK